MRKPNVFHSASRVTSGSIGLGMSRSANLEPESIKSHLPESTYMLGSGKTWMAAEEELLERECEAGVPIGEIARTHKRSYLAIIFRLKQLGLVHPDLANSMVEMQKTLGKGRIALF